MEALPTGCASASAPELHRRGGGMGRLEGFGPNSAGSGSRQGCRSDRTPRELQREQLQPATLTLTQGAWSTKLPHRTMYIFTSKRRTHTHTHTHSTLTSHQHNFTLTGAAAIFFPCCFVFFSVFNPVNHIPALIVHRRVVPSGMFLSDKVYAPVTTSSYFSSAGNLIGADSSN